MALRATPLQTVTVPNTGVWTRLDTQGDHRADRAPYLVVWSAVTVYLSTSGVDGAPDTQDIPDERPFVGPGSIYVGWYDELSVRVATTEASGAVVELTPHVPQRTVPLGTPMPRRGC